MNVGLMNRTILKRFEGNLGRGQGANVALSTATNDYACAALPICSQTAGCFRGVFDCRQLSLPDQ